MIRTISALALLLFSFNAFSTPTAEQADRNTELYNLEQNLGLKGYDPVAYFAEHGGEALEGDSSIQVEYGGVTYNFASENNKQTFLSDPTKYEPTYGGWCAWAMANQAYADINPVLFTQNGNRMHFFISRGAKARFDRNLESRESDADDYWKSESGEEPRI